MLGSLNETDDDDTSTSHNLARANGFSGLFKRTSPNLVEQREKCQISVLPKNSRQGLKSLSIRTSLQNRFCAGIPFLIGRTFSSDIF